MIRKRLLTDLGVSGDEADQYLQDLNGALHEHDIETPLRKAHFLAQVLHESGLMRFVMENMNYSANALLKVFPKYFSPEQARTYARKPKMIGSRVYGGRMGNGDEASGDGYRYRGRGFIQLTGKNNYRKFSGWVGEDVVAQPDLVATKYAVHSAVYFWVSNDLNALADIDDIKKITRRVNGGYNGLSDRMALLERAKKLLVVKAATLDPEEVTHTVSVTQLNLRSAPRVAASTLRATLVQGTQITKLGDAQVTGWSRVRVSLDGRLTEGFVSSQYITAVSRAVAGEVFPPPAETLPVAHMKEGRSDITRDRDGGRAYPLGETGMPGRRGTGLEARVRGLLSIAEYLSSDNPAHLRYQPKGGTTYCNIYAYDYCYLAKVYLPRVWWTERALGAIRGGDEVTVRYGDTVREINANTLYDWLGDCGSVFGWKRVMDLDELQAAANNGDVCVIVAQRRDLNRSGHITAVIPEQDAVTARRNAGGEVTEPVQSQAGRQNFRASTAPGRWWVGAQFRAYGFWRHA